MSDVFHSPRLAGRFFRYRKGGIRPGTSLIGAATEHQWEKDAGKGLRLYHSFCSGSAPNEGEIGDSRLDLAYDDEGAGIWRLWIRRETRSPPKRQATDRARKLAIESNPNLPLERLPKKQARRLVERATKELRHEIHPKIRITEVIASPSWVWIADKTTATNMTIPLLLSSCTGPLDLDPLLWSTERRTPKWKSLSTAALLSLEEGIHLEADVRISGVEVVSGKTRLKVDTEDPSMKKVLDDLIRSRAEVECSKITLEVLHEGAWVSLSADSHGLFEGRPDISRAGLPHERIYRRFQDIIRTCERASRVLTATHDKHS